ncbi:hypothetical protein HDU79_004375 [Rhizoclosmatium sp. JEL0117]|nr:hypothetical protein HDU79_004375 [Rhizoclosmatium sp. JEL0117]
MANLFDFSHILNTAPPFPGINGSGSPDQPILPPALSLQEEIDRFLLESSLTSDSSATASPNSAFGVTPDSGLFSSSFDFLFSYPLSGSTAIAPASPSISDSSAGKASNELSSVPGKSTRGRKPKILTEEEKAAQLEHRKEKNKEFAQVSRDRKRKHVEELEATNAVQAERIRALEEQNRTLMQRVMELTKGADSLGSIFKTPNLASSSSSAVSAGNAHNLNRPKTAPSSSSSNLPVKTTRFTNSAAFFDNEKPSTRPQTPQPMLRPNSPQPSPYALLIPPPPAPSPAISKMKATAALKEQEALEYMKKFTTSPYAAKSAKVVNKRQHVRPSTASSSYSNQPHHQTDLLMTYDPRKQNYSRPTSGMTQSAKNHAAELHAMKLLKLMEREEQDNNLIKSHFSQHPHESPPGSPRGHKSIPGSTTTTISSPLSVKLVADLKDIGVSSETAAIVGAAVANQPQHLQVQESDSYRPMSSASSYRRPPSSTVSQRTRQSAQGDVDPTVAWPKLEPFVNHWGIQNKNRPIGAHSSGYYAKQHHTSFSTSIGQHVGANSPLPTPMSLTMELENEEEDIVGGGRSSSYPHPHSSRSARNSANSGPKNPMEEEHERSKRKTYINETAVTDEQLCIMTDPEVTPEEVLSALSILIGMALDNETVAQSTLFDRGGVFIILHVMNQMPEHPDVQAKACHLLEIMAAKNPLTLTSLYKQNGIMSILAAVQTVSRACQDAKHAVTLMQEAQQQASSTNHTQASSHRQLNKRNWSKSTTQRPPTSNSNDHINKGSNNDILSGSSSIPEVNASGNGSTEKLNPTGKIQPPTIQITGGSNGVNAVNPLVSSLPPSSMPYFDTNNTLVHGILQKYFDPKFVIQLDKMDKVARSEIVKHLLSLFQRIDRLILTGALISLEVDQEIALDQIVREAENLVNSELTLLYLIDPITGDLMAGDCDPWMDPKEKELIREVRFPLGLGIVGWVAQSRQPVNIMRDASKHEQFDHNADTRGESMAVSSILSVPMMTKDGVLKGVLQVINKLGPNGNMLPFNQEDEYLLKMLSTLAAMLVSNAQIYNRLKKSQEKVEALLETTKSLGSTLELDLLVKRIMDAAKDLLMADRCTLFLSDAKAKQLRAHIQGRDSIEEIRIPMTTGIAGFAFTSGESVNIPDAYKDSRFNPEVDKKTGYVTRNMLCIPIRNISGNSIGVTQMINKKVGAFEIDDEKLLTSFSAQAAVAIENSNLFRKTQDMLRETQNMKNYLNMIIQSITNVVITLDKDGHLSHINHPAKMDLTNDEVKEITAQHYETWLGAEKNATLVGDIRRSFSGEENATIIAQDYELHLKGKIKNVNYTIVQMSAGGLNGGDLSGVGGNGGGNGVGAPAMELLLFLRISAPKNEL